MHRKATHNVKIFAENKTKGGCAVYACMGNEMEKMYAYPRQREGFLGMLLTAHIGNIMEAAK